MAKCDYSETDRYGTRSCILKADHERGGILDGHEIRPPHRCKITYFKPSGKYYTEDDGVEWPRDPDHFDGWAPVAKVARIKGMIAVCFDAPQGFPQMFIPPELRR